ncbi:low temperature requirement protein A [Streptomyces sp. NPDC088785]|uniref:low temperature requirement protein A n=1 Tax=Streptomyces sp. NPDC088785 TaxID=3365897 RepID=UPI003805A1BE
MTSSSDTSSPDTEPAAGHERHAGWNELFFDLIAVAGVGRLAHLLHSGPGWGDLGLYALLYLAFWVSWAGFSVYGDVAARSARTSTLLIAMLGMAVMAAAVDGIHSHGYGTAQADAFVIAYVALRWLAGRVWERGSVITDRPLAQMGAGALPWLVSLFVGEPWKYWLWTLGLVVDLVVLLTSSRDRALRAAEEQQARRPRHRIRDPRRGDGTPPRLSEARVDPAHLAERLGLYVIVVLGEGVIQVIDAAAEHEEWNLPLAAAALGSFALLAAIWALSLLYGARGIPQLRGSDLPARLAMLLHAAITAAMAALAAALGVAVAHPDTQLPAAQRWLLCAALAGYFTIDLVAALTTAPKAAWVAGWAAPCILLPLALGAFGAHLPTWAVVWILAAVACWQILYTPGPAAAGHPRRRRTTG